MTRLSLLCQLGWLLAALPVACGGSEAATADRFEAGAGHGGADNDSAAQAGSSGDGQVAGGGALQGAGGACGGADPGTDCGAVDPVGIPCGQAHCQAGLELCVGCQDATTGARDALCADRRAGDFYGATSKASQTLGCAQFTSVFVECTRSSDCPADQACFVVLGETGYLYCQAAADRASTARACLHDSDCPGDAPVCRDFEPLGRGAVYFNPYVETLGWRPRTCVANSRRSSAS